MPAIPWRPITEFVIKAGPILLKAAELATGIRIRQQGAEKEDVSTRIKEIEENIGNQSRLNTELIAQLEMLKPALEGVQKSFRMLFFLTAVACVLSLFAIFLGLVR